MMQFDTFWQFSLSHYSATQETCLKWQNEYQLNVNVILLCCFLEQQNKSLDELQLRQLESSIADTDQLLEKLREVRKACKHQEPEAYRHLLDAELSIEKHQQQQLIETANQMTLLDQGDNLMTYCRLHFIGETTELKRDMATLRLKGEANIEN